MGRKRVRRIMWKLVLFTLFLIYPGVSADVLGMLVCKDINGTSYLLADFSIHCGSPEWLTYIGPTIAMIFIYPIGVPAFFFAMLWRYRHRLEESGVRLQLGFLYAGYNADIWWFEMVDMANKLILTSVLSFFPFNLQLPFGMAFVLAYSMIILLTEPYLSSGDDRLALLANVEIFLVIMASYILNFQGQQVLDPVINVLLSILFIAMTVTIMIAFLWLSARSAYRWLKQYRKTEFVRMLSRISGDGEEEKSVVNMSPGSSQASLG